MNELIPVEVKKKADVSAIVESFEHYEIVTAHDYSGAGEYLKQIKAKTKELDDLRKSLTQPLDESKKRIMDFFKRPLEHLALTESKIKCTMISWQQKQEEIRQEQERKLQEAARKEEERQRKIKEEQECQWREKEEAKRKEAEQLAAAGKAEEAEKARLEADKAAAKAAERAEQAQEINVPVPVVQSKVEKIKGIATKTIWKFKIIDSNKIPREYLMPNEKMLGEVARATKGMVKITGVEFYPEEIMSSINK